MAARGKIVSGVFRRYDDRRRGALAFNRAGRPALAWLGRGGLWLRSGRGRFGARLGLEKGGGVADGAVVGAQHRRGRGRLRLGRQRRGAGLDHRQGIGAFGAILAIEAVRTGTVFARAIVPGAFLTRAIIAIEVAVPVLRAVFAGTVIP